MTQRTAAIFKLVFVLFVFGDTSGNINKGHFKHGLIE